MAIIPILLDVRPQYAGDGSSESLLLLPAGADELLHDVERAVAAVTQHTPLILPLFDHVPEYVWRIRTAARGTRDVISRAVFRDPLARFEASDHLLFVAPTCYPAAGLDLRRLTGAHGGDVRMIRHLLAFETSTLRTKEFVQSGSDGRPRRIQRYYEPVTWPFPAGVIASLVPVACLLTGRDAPWSSLAELRLAMSARSLPSQDVPFHDRFYHLEDESGTLAFAEHQVTKAASAPASRSGDQVDRVIVGQGAVVDPTARMIGPIIVGAGAVVGPDALVVGPALVGAGAQVERGATVAQCLVMADATVASGTVARHRVVTAAAPDLVRTTQRRHTQLVQPAADEPVRSTAYDVVKDVVEPVVALVLLVMLLPLFVVVMTLVALTSPGPVFYGDPREGKDGRAFRCWKFRSMRTDADALQRTLAREQEMDGPQFKMVHDPRVTTLGRWLRRLNVDELPQLWNVLRGEMSFVGPRPSPFRENQICIPWRHGRLSVRPGITGLWQVCRRDRESGDFHQWIHYDLLYVRHASPMVDLRILVATIVTLGGRRPVAVTRIIPAATDAPVPNLPALAMATPIAGARTIAPRARRTARGRA